MPPPPAFDDSPVALFLPAARTLPVVVASPHSGREYDAAFLAGAAVGKDALRRSEDSWVDELVSGAPALGAPVLAARFPRVFVDPNREPFELDPEMFARSASPVDQFPIAAGAAGPWRDPAHRRRRIGHLSPPARPRRGAGASGRQLPSLSPRAEGVASRRAGAVRPCDPSGLPFDAVSGGVPSRRVAGGGFRAWRPARRNMPARNRSDCGSGAARGGVQRGPQRALRRRLRHPLLRAPGTGNAGVCRSRSTARSTWTRRDARNARGWRG